MVDNKRLEYIPMRIIYIALMLSTSKDCNRPVNSKDISENLDQTRFPTKNSVTFNHVQKYLWN